MASKYYIKLYHEILDDPKMMRLTDRLFALTIKLFLLAGDYERDGYLPSVGDMAWRLRCKQEDLETDLADLATTGIIQMRDGSWYVTKFAERQEPVNPTERWRRWKERQRKEMYYQTGDNESANDMQTKRLPDKIRRNKNKEEEGATAPPADNPFWNNEPNEAVTVYRQITGMDPTSTAMDRVIQDMTIILDFYGKDRDEMVKRGEFYYSRWCNTKGKTGKTYSKTNPGWIEWWIGELADVPEDTRVATYEYELSDAERERIRSEQLAALAKRKEMK